MEEKSELSYPHLRRMLSNIHGILDSNILAEERLEDKSGGKERYSYS
jgi:hypothetical protein